MGSNNVLQRRFINIGTTLMFLFIFSTSTVNSFSIRELVKGHKRADKGLGMDLLCGNYIILRVEHIVL